MESFYSDCGPPTISPRDTKQETHESLNRHDVTTELPDLSVPFSCVTRYCSGVRRSFSSSWEKFFTRAFFVLLISKEQHKEDKLHQ